MLKMNLSFFGGRGSGGGNRPDATKLNKNSTASDVVKVWNDQSDHTDLESAFELLEKAGFEPVYNKRTLYSKKLVGQTAIIVDRPYEQGYKPYSMTEVTVTEVSETGSVPGLNPIQMNEYWDVKNDRRGGARDEATLFIKKKK